MDAILIVTYYIENVKRIANHTKLYAVRPQAEY